MTSLHCRRCQKPLTRTQGVYCSVACYRAHVRAARLICPTCGRAFVGNHTGHRYCSRECVLGIATGHYPPYRQASVLEVLRANTHSYLTISDMAIWVLGNDRPGDLQVIRQTLSRLRSRGYVLEWRPALWAAHMGGPTRCYRLVEPVADAEEAAA